MVGCTFQTQQYQAVVHNGIRYEFFDTAGLNETDEGTVPSRQAVNNLIQLIQTSSHGFNLFIHVANARARINRTFQKNHHLFYQALAAASVPLLLVITGCEDVEPMSAFIEQNADYFRINNIQYTRAVATCFAVAQTARLAAVYDQLRNESALAVWEAVASTSTAEPVQFVQRAGGFKVVLRRLAAEVFAALQWPFSWLNRELHKLLTENGVPDAEARQIAIEFD